MNAFLWLIVLSSAFIKCIGLNQSLWLDEAITVNTVQNYTLVNIVRQFAGGDFHPPLYYLFMKLWTNIFGYSEIALRMPSVIFSLITIYIVYLIVRKIKKNAALWGMALVAFNPLLIYYAQEARMYSMVTMLITLAIYAKIRNKKWELYAWSFLAFATFYGSVFILFALDIFNWGLYGSMLILLPLIIKQYMTSRTLLGEVVNWDLTLGIINMKNLFLIFVKLVTGRVPFTKWYILPTLLVWLAALKSGLKNKYFLRLLILPLILGLLFSIKVPMLQYFRFQYLVIPLSILMAMVGQLRGLPLRYILIIFFVLFSFMYVMNSNNYREDWKGISKNLPETVYMIGSFADPVKYYRGDIKIIDIKLNQPTEKSFIYIPYGEVIHGFDHKELFAKIGYKKIQEKSFREITYEEWQR